MIITDQNWLFKRLKNIENKNKEQLEAIKDYEKKQLTNSKSLKAISYFNQLSSKACMRELQKKKMTLILKNLFV